MEVFVKLGSQSRASWHTECLGMLFFLRDILFLGFLKIAALQVGLPTQKQPMFQHTFPTHQSAWVCSTFSLAACKISCQPVASRQAIITQLVSPQPILDTGKSFFMQPTVLICVDSGAPLLKHVTQSDRQIQTAVLSASLHGCVGDTGGLWTRF